ncbi:MAG TPA: M20/M25/M40 family metallo-hydrolase [Xanthomonadaceae bacterium]|nr:M20/M25/M40 family metallo-hydrolase [Xanthomonadaceae bacterium]
MARCTALLLTALAFAAAEAAPTPGPVAQWRSAHEHSLLQEYLPFLELPNVATDRAAIDRVAEALVVLMQRRGLQPRRLRLDDADVPPLVVGEWTVPGATETLVFYAHYDGQPVTPEDWSGDPWVPWLYDPRSGAPVALEQGRPIDPEWRIRARGAADDKAGVMVLLWAIDALRASGIEPRVNVRLLFEGEEEQGSPHLAQLLARHREVLGPHPWIIADGPRHASGRMQVVFGVRGDANVELTTYGARRPLHSGHYGNWAPNPALAMATLLASMKDADGHVVVADWHQDEVPLAAHERDALAAVPQADEALRRELGLGRVEYPALGLLEATSRASLNINGVRAGDVGAQASNVIPTIARATLDLRLGKGQTPQRQYTKLLAHVRGQGFHVLGRDPTDAERLEHPRIVRMELLPGAYPASRTAMDAPFAQRVVAAVQSVSPEPVIRLPTLGGSLPLAVVNEVLGAPTLIVPISNHDNNQHAEDENIRLGNLWDGIAIYAAIMAHPHSASEPAASAGAAPGAAR